MDLSLSKQPSPSGQPPEVVLPPMRKAPPHFTPSPQHLLSVKMKLIRLKKYSVISRGSLQCKSAPENCQQINMAFLSHSLKASGLYIKFACAIQRVAKSGTPSSIAFLSFSPRSPRVHVTQGFIAQGVVAGKKSTESALTLYLDLLEITTA